MTHQVFSSVTPVIHKYDLWIADLPSPVSGNHVISGRRPIIVIANDESGPLISVVPLTSHLDKPQKATHVLIRSKYLRSHSRALCEQVLTLDKTLLTQRIGSIEDAFERHSLSHALEVHFGLKA